MASAAPSPLALPLTRISGEQITLASLQGSVILIVNVASHCGLTPQYEGLEQLFRTYKDRQFTILGFPANDFGDQEPGSNEEIASFCTGTFGATFPLFQKTVVTGPSKHPLYAALITAQPTAEPGDPGFRPHLDEFLAARNEHTQQPPEVLWNFEKFLLDRHGRVIARFAPDILPTDPRVIAAIEAALAQA